MFNAGVSNWQQCGGMEYFGQDETIAGVAAGKRLAAAGAKHVLCVLQAQGQVQLEARCAGVKQGLGSEGTMTKQYVNGTDNSAMLSSMSAKLTQDKNIDAVITLGAPVALVAIQAISQANSTAKLYTFDTNAEEIAKIKSGAVQWAVDQQPYLQGYESVDSLWLYLTNGDVLGGGQTVLTGPSFIDSSNVAQVAALRGARHALTDRGAGAARRRPPPRTGTDGGFHDSGNATRGSATPPPVLDERIGRRSTLARLFARPEAGAVAGAIVIYIFFFVIAPAVPLRELVLQRPVRHLDLRPAGHAGGAADDRRRVRPVGRRRGRPARR